jgi:mRNA interferase HigB
MHLISASPLRDFWITHPNAESALRTWIKAVRSASWGNFADVGQTFNSADQYGKFTIFNIGGNKYRLIAVIHFNRQKVYVRHIMTHQEYDHGKWQG